MTLFKLYHELLMHQIDYASKTLFRSSERCNAGPKIVWCIFRVHVKTGFFNFPQATVQPQVTYTVIILNLAFSCDYLVQYLFSSTPFFRLQCYCSFFVLYSLHHYPHVISDCCLRFKTSVPFSDTKARQLKLAGFLATNESATRGTPELRRLDTY